MLLSINEIESDIKTLWVKWHKDVRRIWKQSKLIFLILFLSQIVLGLLPYVTFRWFGGFLHVLVGARSLRLWTDDLRSMAWMFLGIIIFFCISISVTMLFKGRVASVARAVRWFVCILSILIFLFPISPLFISAIGLFLIAEIWIKPRARILIWLTIIGFICWFEWNLMNAIVLQAMSLGEGLSMMIFILLIPTRQFIDRYFVCV